jgi:hypothetical protein
MLNFSNPKNEEKETQLVESFSKSKTSTVVILVQCTWKGLTFKLQCYIKIDIILKNL